ncbi:methyltransferase domain-containing protein [Paenibacillus sp. FSL M8-0334]|uniref:Methyltransferase domain-containing protein n=1 Tax=Paenibacillus campinasensis TaxID=66347 RepID=A0ABW9T4V9_9BACL|nr:methyltransferase domain-containing protein [Paenibacillus campinasensis]MUG67204.1 methyltransferase domain-containing protein [Paenibacillus campinasensis]
MNHHKLSQNIYRYRKEQGLTQERLAQQLGVTFQAVSKWENGQSLPDVSLLPELSRQLAVSMDRLFGYTSAGKPVTIYEEEYKTPDYYWGTEPSVTCYKVLELMPPTRRLKVLDIGCGEGKDAVFLARNGYDVTAFDISDAGIEKTKMLAERTGVHVHVFKADIRDFRLETEFDIVYSSGVLHYIRPEYRAEIFANYKQFTAKGGMHFLNVFVQKPFIAPPPENEPYAYDWISGELLSLYHDWMIHDCPEVVFDCNSSGVPHQHAMSKLIAQKL